MSFGVGIGDFVTISQITLSIYQQLQDAPQEFQSLSTELGNLRNVVDSVAEAVARNEIDPNQRDRLVQMQNGCFDVLKEMEGLISRYRSLGTNRVQKWRWIGLGSRRVPGIRQRLNSNIGLLTSLHTSIVMSSVSRVEKGLIQIQQGLQSGRRQGSILSAESVDEVKEGNQDTWRELCRALEDTGVSEEMVNEHRDFIVQWLSKALAEGQLEELPSSGMEQWVGVDPLSDEPQTEVSTGSAMNADVKSPPAEYTPLPKDPETVLGEAFEADTSEAEALSAALSGKASPAVSILFVDDKNTVRSPLAKAYLDHIRNKVPTLQKLISSVDSAGMRTDLTPSEHALEGVQGFLRDTGICADFHHTVRQVNPDDFATFKYILAMNQYQTDRVNLDRLPTRRLDGEFRLLGSFGRHGPRSVTEPACIGDWEWFEVGGARVYPGYVNCFSDIQTYIHDFVSDVFGIDVQATDGAEDARIRGVKNRGRFEMLRCA